MNTTRRRMDGVILAALVLLVLWAGLRIVSHPAQVLRQTDLTRDAALRVCPGLEVTPAELDALRAIAALPEVVSVQSESEDVVTESAQALLGEVLPDLEVKHLSVSGQVIYVDAQRDGDRHIYFWHPDGFIKIVAMNSSLGDEPPKTFFENRNNETYVKLTRYLDLWSSLMGT